MVVRLTDTYSFTLPPLIFSFPYSQLELQLLEVLYLVVVTQTFISEFFESSTTLTLLAAVFLHPPSLSGLEMLGSTVPRGWPPFPLPCSLCCTGVSTRPWTLAVSSLCCSLDALQSLPLLWSPLKLAALGWLWTWVRSSLRHCLQNLTGPAAHGIWLWVVEGGRCSNLTFTLGERSPHIPDHCAPDSLPRRGP